MVGLRWRGVVGLVALCVCGAASAQVFLYERENFGGRSFRAANSVSNLDETGFNDRAASVEVRGGRWQLCDDAFFRGRCVVVESGRYPSLREMGLDHRVSSMRELGWTPDDRDGFRGRRDDGRGDDGRRGDPRFGGGQAGGGRAILFAGQGLSGRTFVVGAGGVGDLNDVGFNDRARSLRVEGGYWIFCSDAHFGGNCQTYAPGDYPSLPRGQNDSISSGRPIAERDPPRGRGGRN